MRATKPIFKLIAGIALIGVTVMLIKNEGWSFKNALPAIIGLVLVSGGSVGFATSILPEWIGELRVPDRAAMLERSQFVFCERDGGLVIVDATTRELLGSSLLKHERRFVWSRLVRVDVNEHSGKQGEENTVFYITPIRGFFPMLSQPTKYSVHDSGGGAIGRFRKNRSLWRLTGFGGDGVDVFGTMSDKQATLNRPWASTGGAFEILDRSKAKIGSIKFDFRNNSGTDNVNKLMNLFSEYPVVSIPEDMEQAAKKLVLAASIATCVGLLTWSTGATDGGDGGD
jgi:hypothetical protein